jgi:hypothetical protein
MRRLMIAIVVVVQVLILLFGVLPRLLGSWGTSNVLGLTLLSLFILILIMPDEEL